MMSPTTPTSNTRLEEKNPSHDGFISSHEMLANAAERLSRPCIQSLLTEEEYFCLAAGAGLDRRSPSRHSSTRSQQERLRRSPSEVAELWNRFVVANKDFHISCVEDDRVEPPPPTEDTMSCRLNEDDVGPRGGSISMISTKATQERAERTSSPDPKIFCSTMQQLFKSASVLSSEEIRIYRNKPNNKRMTAAVAAQHSRRGAKKIPLEPCFCSPLLGHQEGGVSVLFENDLLLCVNKRSGTRVTPFNRLTNQMSCLNLAYGYLLSDRRHHAAQSPKNDRTPPPIPLHRLDDHTSGALLFAKTSEAAKKFGAAEFWQKHVRKTYLALVEAGADEQILDCDCDVVGGGGRGGLETEVVSRLDRAGATGVGNVCAHCRDGRHTGLPSGRMPVRNVQRHLQPSAMVRPRLSVCGGTGPVLSATGVEQQQSRIFSSAPSTYLALVEEGADEQILDIGKRKSTLADALIAAAAAESRLSCGSAVSCGLGNFGGCVPHGWAPMGSGCVVAPTEEYQGGLQPKTLDFSGLTEVDRGSTQDSRRTEASSPSPRPPGDRWVEGADEQILDCEVIVGGGGRGGASKVSGRRSKFPGRGRENLHLQDEELDAAEHDGSAGPAREEDDLRKVPRNKPIFFLVDSPIDGKRAQTTVEIFTLWRGGGGKNIALAKCELKEGGRRHQIRKHCASIGWALVGDREYNTTTHKGPFFLHAWKLEIGGENQTLDLSEFSENQRLLDTNRSPIRITAPLPERFLEEVAKWGAGLPDLLFGPGGPLAEGRQEVQSWELGRKLEHHF